MGAFYYYVCGLPLGFKGKSVTSFFTFHYTELVRSCDVYRTFKDYIELLRHLCKLVEDPPFRIGKKLKHHRGQETKNAVFGPLNPPFQSI